MTKGRGSWCRIGFIYPSQLSNMFLNGAYSSEVLLHATKDRSGLGDVALNLILLALDQGYLPGSVPRLRPVFRHLKAVLYVEGATCGRQAAAEGSGK